MKHISPLIIGLSIFLLDRPTSACNCVSQASFIQNTTSAELVVRGKVIEHNWYRKGIQQDRPRSMTIEVNEVYKGKIKSRKIIAWGDNGIICRRYVSGFPIGTEWVFALSQDSWTEKGELAISSCGENSLRVKGNSVIGKVKDGNYKAKPQVMSLPNLRKQLKSLR
jgi:hypothetical protein